MTSAIMKNFFRFTLLISVLALGAAVETYAADNTVDLILVAGQSNAVGADANPTDLAPSDIDREVMFWWRTGDPPPDKHDSTSARKWTHLQPQPLGNPKKPRDGKARQWGNFSHPDGGFGPEIEMGRVLAMVMKHDDRGGNKRLAIVKAAFSGTGIRRDWNPTSKTDSGACYRALVEETKAAIKAAEAKGLKMRLRGFTWVQGESDANARDAAHYEKALREMIAALRKDLNAPEMIALLAINTRFSGGKNKFVPKIVEAQKAVAATDTRCAYVDTSQASTANNVHYDAGGTVWVGHLFAERLLMVEAELE
jgi:hypothetical protein